MLLSIKIPDELYEKYGKHNPQNPRLAIEQALARWAEVTPNKRAVVLTGKDLTEVQDLLSGVFETPEALLEALRKAFQLKIEGVEIALTESQRKAVIDWCNYIKMDQKEFVEQKVKQGLHNAFGV